MNGFFYGVIEGFYGRQWSWQARSGYSEFLSAHGFDCYIYAPKGDLFLRSQWQAPWDETRHSQLINLATSYHKAGLRFGVGLSPKGLFQDYSDKARTLLRQKVQQINALGVDILCILFDDMPGDFPLLAARQLQIVEDIMAVSKAGQHIICPTYYSFDPILETVFGLMPDNYLSDLGKDLPPDVGVFWTGEKVISEDYRKQDIDKISSLIDRSPILWDNYPVNDGRLTSNHLHLRPYRGRPAELRNWVQGHCVNPMNQPALSKLVLAGLAEIYSGAGNAKSPDSLQVTLQSVAPEKLKALLAEDINFFQDQGLSAMTRSQVSGYIDRYKAFDQDIAGEIVQWLQGAYAFDPDCLTE